MPEAKGRNGVQLNIRLDEKVRYLTDLACAAQGVSLTDYITWALTKSFADVTLRRRSEPEPEYGTGPDDLSIPEAPDENEERRLDALMSIAEHQDDLWSESEFQRLEMRRILAPHLMTERGEQLFRYVHSQQKYRTERDRGYVINRELVNAEWQTIVTNYEKQTKRGRK